MNWIELLLCAVATVLSAAAFRKAGANAGGDAKEAAREAALRQDFALLREHIDALPGRIADEVAASPLREAMEAVRGDISDVGNSLDAHGAKVGEAQKALVASLTESVTASLSGVAAPLREIGAGQGRLSEAVAGLARAHDAATASAREDAKASREDAKAAREEARNGLAALGQIREATAAGLDKLGAQVEALGAAVAGSGSDEALAEEIRKVSAALEAWKQEWSSATAQRQQVLGALPVRIAEEVASRPAPAPELEELAVAVRESGHLRGDVARQVAESVSRVGQELSEAAERARSEREGTASTLDAASVALAAAVEAVRDAVGPLHEALSSHGHAVAPLAVAFESVRGVLEEASGSQRANQAEFAASVEVFTRGAQELATGLSAFAREGELDVSEDPRAVQKALLESLDKLLSGFGESLRALLAESDIRTRETLAELAARLPGAGPVA